MSSSSRPILFVSLPESGLFNPVQTIAGEFARRGVPDLWFATDEERRGDVEALADASTVRFASLGEVVPELSALTWDEDVYAKVTGPKRFAAHAAIIRHTYDPALHVDKYRRLLEIVEEVKPALMVIESLTAYAIDIAITRKIPYVLVVPFLPSNYVTSYTPFGKAYTNADFPVPHSGLSVNMTRRQRIENRLFRWRTMGIFLRPSMMRMLRKDKLTREELGIDPVARRFMAKIDRADLVLVTSLAELDYPFTVPDNMRMVGALIPPLPQAPDDGLGDWLSKHESVAFVGLGTTTRLTAAHVSDVLEVARRLADRTHFLWKLPKSQQHLLPDGPLPANVRIESWVPSQLDVLAHPNVKLFVTHGGGNGFHEGLYFGKPMVVRPLWVDCHDQAVRGQDFGVSLTIDPHRAGADDVERAITRVLDEPSFGERARHFGELLRAAGGAAAATDLVLDLPALTGHPATDEQART
ncbi:glycosyltransferase [Streptomyces mutabilis]|uniref:MGT family glycosyltransferase n=1 Tax=Streptomyces mutabilis TaxID=67332 RepID=A0A086MQR9_9ACTN|nr:glycosyltransferase [Streptomyces mutabilis]KFG71237.1 MGT family glycosyltransferase [Streptomyces mutabilis]